MSPVFSLVDKRELGMKKEGPCPFFGATTTSDRTGGPIAPWANFTVNCKKTYENLSFPFSFHHITTTTEQK